MSEIDLDKELGGKPFNEKTLANLTYAQRTILHEISINERMTKLCEESKKAKRKLGMPPLGLQDRMRWATADILSDTEVIGSHIRERIRTLLRAAINDLNLGHLALIQRMCQRYGLTDYIKEKLAGEKTA